MKRQGIRVKVVAKSDFIGGQSCKFILFCDAKGKMMLETTKRENPLYTMKLHESISLDDTNMVLRVPGGWIYHNGIKAPGRNGQFLASAVVFVPFDNEFQANVGFVGRRMSSR